MPRIDITARLSIESTDLTFQYLAGTGPGGQNVNKVATAAQLRFDTRSLALPDDVRGRLRGLAGSRMTQDGVIVITARRHRTQERNRQDAIERLIALIREALIRQAPRRATRASYGERQRRLEAKRQRSAVKQQRRGGRDD
jgi:ribosome-associated protein